jgi:hypothetical protein
MPAPPHHVLGISSQATESEIKKAYRELAKKWHPDKYPGKEAYATEQFKRIQEAYETMLIELGNPTGPSENPYSSSRFQNTGTFRQPFAGGVHQNIPQFTSRNGFGVRMPTGQRRSVPTGNTFTRPNIGTCNQNACATGPVIFPGNFHPSHMSFEMLQQLRQARGT